MELREFPQQLKTGYPELTRVFATHWQTRLSDYAARLFDTAPQQLEPELIRAFQVELEAVGVEETEREPIVTRLQEKPVLQTSHHITPTHGPTFLAIDLICLAGLKPQDLYLIGANSGVSFSNSAWSGALSYGDLPLDTLIDPQSHSVQRMRNSQRERIAHGDRDNRISIIPARQRDQLVFGTEATEFQADLFRHFSPSLKALLREVKPGQLLSHWAAGTASSIQNRILNTRQFLILDINRVVTHYLVEVLRSRPDHPCCELLSDSRTAGNIRQSFREPPLFLGNYRGKKSSKVEGLSWAGNGLKSPRQGFQALDRGELVGRLRSFELCPAIFLLFFILRFINGIRCLGSFSQIEYLETYRRTWESVSPGWGRHLAPDSERSLTTGRLIQNGQAVWPLDLAMTGERLSVDAFADMEMGTFWEPILRQLTGSSQNRLDPRMEDDESI